MDLPCRGTPRLRAVAAFCLAGLALHQSAASPLDE
jgi:hypothetical protein